MKFVIFAGLAVVLVGCASTPPPSGVKVNFVRTERTLEEQAAAENAKPAPPSTVIVPDYAVPGVVQQDDNLPVGEQTKAVAENTAKFIVSPMKMSFSGGAVSYPFVSNQIYKVFLQPMMTTYISLEPGETIVSPPLAGDAINFQAYSAAGRVEGQSSTNIILKALYPGRQTNFTVFTDRRTYNFMLYSFKEVFMPIVTFTYPEKTLTNAKVAEAQNSLLNLQVPLTSCDFRYDVLFESISKPEWAPAVIFNDGKRTYIQFPSARKAAFAPVLFLEDKNNNLVVVDYHLVGTYYIVDTVIERARLVLDRNNGNSITIKRIGG